MNACKAAIQAAHSYWTAHGVELTAAHVEAHQAPLPGSAWGVRATASDGTTQVLLVTRKEKNRYQCRPQCPYGYTIYAFSGSGERPLAQVEYEVQAREQIAVWRNLPSYAQVALDYLENTSATWAEAIGAQIETRARHQARGREQRLARRQQLAYALHPRPLDPTPHPISGWEDIAPLLWRLLDASGLPHARSLDRKLLVFLEQQQRPDGGCLPFGYAWTHFQQMLLLPGDARSALQVFILRRWREHCACFWFDGRQLTACSVATLEAAIVPRSL